VSDGTFNMTGKEAAISYNKVSGNYYAMRNDGSGKGGGVYVGGPSCTFNMNGEYAAINYNEALELNETAFVLANETEVLFGALPLKGMDVMVSPQFEKVVGAHGDQPLRIVK
jgi:hypothetical protein